MSTEVSPLAAETEPRQRLHGPVRRWLDRRGDDVADVADVANVHGDVSTWASSAADSSSTSDGISDAR